MVNERADAQRKIGIFGGTFNPVHYGHLMIAENACEQFGLEKVIFMPTGHSPHKPFMGEDMNRHRCRMVELAIADNPLFGISYREIENPGVNCTYETLRQLNEEQPDTQFHFILGADSLFDFLFWRHPEMICREAVILAAVRDTLDEKKVDEQISYLCRKLQGQIYRLNTPNFNVSSKSIRERIGKGQTIRYLVPDTVSDYIRSNGLYSVLSEGGDDEYEI